HALLRKFNELLPVYGVSAVPENALSTTISLLAFPVTLVLAAVICWRMIRRWENHLQRLLLKLFHQPLKLVVCFSLLCLFVQSFGFLFAGVVMLLEKWINLKNALANPGYTGYSIILLMAAHTLVLAFLMS